MIRVDVGDHEVPHIRQADVQRAQMPFERMQRVSGVPAAIDEQKTIVGANEVRIDVAEGAIPKRQRQAPDAWKKLRALGERLRSLRPQAASSRSWRSRWRSGHASSASA